MITSVLKRFCGMSVGFKITTGVVVLMVAIVGAMVTLQHHLLGQRLREHAWTQMERGLDQASQFCQATMDLPTERRRAQWVRMARPMAQAGLHLFALRQDGGILVPPVQDKLPVPPPHILTQMAYEAPGRREIVLAQSGYLLAYRPSLQGGQVLVVQSSVEEQMGDLHQEASLNLFFSALVLALLGVVAAWWLTRRQISAPLALLTREAERVAAGDLTPPVPLAGRVDELGRMSVALNHMTTTAQGMVETARASQSRFQQLFTQHRDGAFITDQHGRLEEVNPAMVRMFSCQSAGELLNVPDTSLLFADALEKELYDNTLSGQGYVHDFPASLRRRDGRLFDAMITATRDQVTHRRFGLIRDVTQMRTAQRALTESEERYRRLVENAPDVIFRWSLDQESFDYLSPAALVITGYRPDYLSTRQDLLTLLVPEEWRHQVLNHWFRLVAGDDSGLQTECQIRGKDGRLRWVQARCLLVRDATERPVAVEGIITEITERVQVEKALIQGQEMVEAALQGLPTAVLVVDTKHRVVHWNRAMERLSGVPATAMVGTDQQALPFYGQRRPILADLVLDDDQHAMEERYGHFRLQRAPVIEGAYEAEVYFPELGGRERYLRVLAAPIRDRGGQVVRAVETLWDITDLRQLEEKLRRLSVTDDLTGLYNQRFFYANLGKEVAMARRHDRPLSVLMTDLDYFKDYNDRFGHLEGDRALTACAEKVRQSVRQSDIACRYGGEEFAVILPDTDREAAMHVAMRIRESVAAMRLSPLGAVDPVRVTMSLGVAQLGQKMDMDGLVRLADAALYAAKSAGRDQVFMAPGPGDEPGPEDDED